MPWITDELREFERDLAGRESFEERTASMTIVANCFLASLTRQPAIVKSVRFVAGPVSNWKRRFFRLTVTIDETERVFDQHRAGFYMVVAGASLHLNIGEVQHFLLSNALACRSLCRSFGPQIVRIYLGWTYGGEAADLINNLSADDRSKALLVSALATDPKLVKSAIVDSDTVEALQYLNGPHTVAEFQTLVTALKEEDIAEAFGF